MLRFGTLKTYSIKRDIPLTDIPLSGFDCIETTYKKIILKVLTCKRGERECMLTQCFGCLQNKFSDMLRETLSQL